MKKWIVTTADGNQFGWYAASRDVALTAEGAVDAVEDDTPFEQYIQELLASEMTVQISGKPQETPTYLLRHPEGDLIIMLLLDLSDGRFYDELYFKEAETDWLWTPSSPEIFVSQYLHRKSIALSIYSQQQYRGTALKKPEEIKGVQRAFSVPLHERCVCTCFLHHDDLWIKCRDFFSPIWHPPENDVGFPTRYYMEKYFHSSGPKSKFLYDDCYGSIILRVEAWLVVRNLLPGLSLHGTRKTSALVEDQFKKLIGAQLLPPEWNAFWKSTIRAAAKETDKKTAGITPGCFSLPAFRHRCNVNRRRTY